MEKEKQKKIAALNEGIQEELDALVSDLEYRVDKITKYKDEILKILDGSSKLLSSNIKIANSQQGERAMVHASQSISNKRDKGSLADSDSVQKTKEEVE